MPYVSNISVHDLCFIVFNGLVRAGGVVVSTRLPTQEVGGSIPVSASIREVR